MSAPLVITRRSVAGVVILELAGRLMYDDDGERLLRERITSVIAAGDRQILLDLSAVSHMDSGSVGTLVAMHLHTLKHGGRLKLLAPSDRVRRVLHVTRLASIFDIFDDEGAAILSYRPRAAAR